MSPPNISLLCMFACVSWTCAALLTLLFAVLCRTDPEKPSAEESLSGTNWGGLGWRKRQRCQPCSRSCKGMTSHLWVCSMYNCICKLDNSVISALSCRLPNGHRIGAQWCSGEHSSGPLGACVSVGPPVSRQLIPGDPEIDCGWLFIYNCYS